MFLKSRNVWLGGLLILNGCAATPSKPAPFVMTNDSTALAAEFETSVITENHRQEPETANYRWRFWRSPTYVQTYNLQDDTGEAWTKSPSGEIGYQRLFHAQQQSIDYLPGDLKAIGSALDWPMLASLLNREMIKDLACSDDVDALDRQIQRCHTRSEPEALQLVWLTQEQLPASITLMEHEHRLTTRLLAAYPLAKSPWVQPSSDHYRQIDFADIGDKENDPFIKSILSKLKGGASHHH